MKKIFLVIFMSVLLFSVSSNAFALGDRNSCSTKYPLVLAHGMGASAQILGIVDYWWGVEDALKNENAQVYITSVNGMDSTENKAKDFTRQFLEIMAISGAEKANIIGHSHGTLYTRYAITNLGLSGRVASHTSIAGPHQGSTIADFIMKGVPVEYHDEIGEVMDFIYSYLFGDTNPDSISNGWEVTTDYVKNIFNPNTPNIAGIYYQSWAAVAKTACSSLIMEPTWLIMLATDGPNDGLVSVESAKWGEFRGIESGSNASPGVDHLNIIGHFIGLTPGFDAGDFYTGIVSDLKNKGF